MLFGTGKRLNLFRGRQVNLSVNGSPVNTTTCYKYLGVHLDQTLNFDTHLHKIYKKAAGRVNLFRRIRSSIDTFSAQRIYQSMIMPVFTCCGYNSLGFSESRKRMISSIGKRRLEIITPKCSPKNCDLGFLAIETCCFVFDCLDGTTWFPFRNYFQRFHHNSLNTRNNGKAAKLPKVKLYSHWGLSRTNALCVPWDSCTVSTVDPWGNSLCSYICEFGINWPVFMLLIPLSVKTDTRPSLSPTHLPCSNGTL